ncbi:hypothetical protein JCM14469_42520 [Desulfatiferula olefinivorans]
MKTWVRWKGLAAFAGVLVLLVVFFKFYAGIVVEKTIEFAGTRAVGARVDLADADLSLFPLGITLTGLEVTDPDAPMTNLFEVATARFALDPGALLLRKTIVDTMSVNGVRVKTDRRVSGEIIKKDRTTPKPASPSPEKKAWSMPALSMPDVKTVLERETLNSVAEARAIKKDLEKSRADFEGKLMGLPDKESFEAYEDRLKALKSGKVKLSNVLSRAEDLKKLKKDVDADLAKIKAVRKELNTQAASYRARIEALPGLAQADVKRIKETYAPNPKGMGNVTAMFFGPTLAAWVEKGLTWYNKLKPYLRKNESPEAEAAPDNETVQRGKGVDVAFREKEPQPGFLVRHGDLSLSLAAGEMTGIVQQVTAEQHLTGQPVTLELGGTNLTNLSEARIVGVIDRVRPDEDRDRLMVSLKGLGLDGRDLAADSAMAVRLDKGLADFNLVLDITDGSLNGLCKVTLTDLSLVTKNADPSDRLSRVFSKTLADVRTVELNCALSGTVDAYKADLGSNLDDLLKDAVRGIVKDLSDEFTNELTAAIEERSAVGAQGLAGELDLFSSLDQDLEKRLDVGREVLKGI